MKVITVVGTRPEIIRLSRVIYALDRYMDHVLVHTGQNYDYELNQVFFEDLEIRKPDHFLSVVGEGLADTLGNIIIAVDRVLEKEAPDALLVLGDTNSCLSVIPAKRRKIPVFHMEAGNRCFDQRVPEEINRKIVDHVSDINMPYSDIAREYLLREGILPDRIVKTGSPMFEVLSHYNNNIESSDVLQRMGLEEGKFCVFSSHREENVDEKHRLSNIVGILNAMTAKYGYPIIMSTHPRTRKRIEQYGFEMDDKVQMLPPLGFFDYVKLQKKSFVTLSDSGTITEESSILGFPAVNIRDAHERPEGMEEGVAIMSGITIDSVLESVEMTVDMYVPGEFPVLVRDYSSPFVSKKVVKIIRSYTNYINQNVWMKTAGLSL